MRKKKLLNGRRLGECFHKKRTDIPSNYFLASTLNMFSAKRNTVERATYSFFISPILHFSPR